MFIKLPAGLLATLCLVQPALGKKEIDIDHPKLSQDAMLPQIVSELRQTIADPRSIQDFQICPPIKVKWKNGTPDSWTVPMSFNSRNAQGGYSGRAAHYAAFREGKKPRIISIEVTGYTGIDGAISSEALRQTADCPRVPDEEIQRLLK
jgi:hypothetical protein